MVLRRNLIIGAACVSALGAATALRPRREVTLLKGAKLADIVPRAFGGWTSEDVSDPYAVNGEGTLSAKLYNELLTRLYTNQEAGLQIIMLLAYGGRQSDELQLHRPEVCYPAFGYELQQNEPSRVRIGDRASIPARQILAVAEERRESIVYWSRIGETLPQDGEEQREARLRISMQGVIPDGLLSRFSTMGGYPKRDWPMIASFIGELVIAIAPDQRKVLIGTQQAELLSAIPSTARSLAGEPA